MTNATNTCEECREHPAREQAAERTECGSCGLLTGGQTATFRAERARVESVRAAFRAREDVVRMGERGREITRLAMVLAALGRTAAVVLALSMVGCIPPLPFEREGGEIPLQGAWVLPETAGTLVVVTDPAALTYVGEFFPLGMVDADVSTPETVLTDVYGGSGEILDYAAGIARVSWVHVDPAGVTETVALSVSIPDPREPDVGEFRAVVDGAELTFRVERGMP